MLSRFWDEFGPATQALAIALLGWIIVFWILDVTFGIAYTCIDFDGWPICF